VRGGGLRSQCGTTTGEDASATAIHEDPVGMQNRMRCWLSRLAGADTGRYGDHRALLVRHAHRSLRGTGVLLRTRSRAQAGAHRAGFLGLRAPGWPPRRGIRRQLTRQGAFQYRSGRRLRRA
jgi:hypothetical protein